MNVAFQILDTSSYFLGNIVGFVAKQSFCVTGLEPIRQQLEQTISSIASSIFGSFLGRMIGNQLSYISAIPMTSFLGNLIWEWVADIPQACVSISRSIFIPNINSQKLPQWLYTAVRMSGTVLGYLVNSYFCFNAMPMVRQGLEEILKHIVPYILPWQIGPLLPFIALCLTPTITFSSGDLLGMITRKLTIISGHAILNRFDDETNLMDSSPT